MVNEEEMFYLFEDTNVLLVFFGVFFVRPSKNAIFV